MRFDALKKSDMENQIFRAGDTDWQPLDEPGITGIYIKSLMYDAETKRSPTILLKFDPGARYPVHNHPAGEEIYVLEGDIHLGKDHLFAGDYIYTAPGNIHAVRTDGGCVVLLKAPEEVVIIKPRTGSAD
jgi:quercetin dioxygenase-like cupin family protein